MNRRLAHTTLGLAFSNPFDPAAAIVPYQTTGLTQDDEGPVGFNRAATSLKNAVVAHLLLMGAFVGAGGADAAALTGTPAAWSAAFPATGGARPLHLQASFPGTDGQAHVLEFWRNPAGRMVRRTDGRVELRLTPAADGEDAYQLRDIQKRVVYDVHRVNLFRIGVFTDRWSAQHLLDQPKGVYTLTTGKVQNTALGACTWVRVTPVQGPTLDVCWSAINGIPLLERSGGREVLRVKALQNAGVTLPTAALPEGWQEFNADEDIAPD